MNFIKFAAFRAAIDNNNKLTELELTELLAKFMRKMFDTLTLPLYIHKNRKSLYAALAVGEVQCAFPVKEGDKLVIYQGDNGKFWLRPLDEFFDGRFKQVDAKTESISHLADNCEDYK